MRRSFLTTFALCLSALVIMTVGTAVAKDKKAKEGQVTGTVHMINKDTSTITVSKGNVQRQVVYNNDTKWMYGVQSSAKAATMDQLKDGWYINCKGTFDGVKLVASACRFREGK
jgi:hypothetical protein